MKSEFFKNNRNKYIELIDNNSLSLFFSGISIQKSADQEYDFEVDKNFYYLTGINQANVTLGIIKKDDTVKEVLFIEKNDPVLSKWVGVKLEKEEAKALSNIDNINYQDEFKNFVFSVFNNSRNSVNGLEALYLNLERRNVNNYTNLALDFSKAFKNDYPEIRIENSYDLVISLRMIKSDEEIELIKSSIETTRYGIEQLMLKSQVGLYEYQLETYFDAYIKFNGQKENGFKAIAASGKNATILHYIENNCVLKDNELILFDLGSRTDFYQSDISRTFPINGKFTKRQYAIYQEVLDVNKKCIKFIKPNITWLEFNQYARDLLTESCKRLGLITDPKDLVKYYYHSIGHFLGLDTHDPGIHDHKFQEGMVITIEPGIYIEEEEIGVRIEDNILITKDGGINLSKDIIKEIADIENFMVASKK